MSAIITLGSLFDGIGGFPLAAVRHGITPIWASEIEKFPIEVTKIRFPDMVHIGDITKLKGANLPPVDIVAGGSPCQNLSVAGNREGLAGDRSGLFFEQIRIIREMRDESIRNGRTDKSVQPRYGIWENVPGAFSSGEPSGEDFRVVIEEFLRIVDSSVVVPRPPAGAWESAGSVMGAGFSLAFRVLDARYHGLAQRRKRIFLVCDFGGESAPSVLFDPYRVPWNTAEGEEARQGTACGTGGGAQTASGYTDGCVAPMAEDCG